MPARRWGGPRGGPPYRIFQLQPVGSLSCRNEVRTGIRKIALLCQSGPVNHVPMRCGFFDLLPAGISGYHLFKTLGKQNGQLPRAVPAIEGQFLAGLSRAGCSVSSRV